MFSKLQQAIALVTREKKLAKKKYLDNKKKAAPAQKTEPKQGPSGSGKGKQKGKKKFSKKANPKAAKKEEEKDD